LKLRQEDKALLDKLIVMPSSLFGETANNEKRKRLPQSDESMQQSNKKRSK
jgi:hypothetical protein